MWHVVLLIVCAVAIYLSCEWFINAVEWLGQRLNVGKMAVGTVLAAFGTALPESVVTLVAVTTGDSRQARDIGIGAAMGGPLALATVAYGVTGIALLVRRVRSQRARRPVLAGKAGAATEHADDSAPAERSGERRAAVLASAADTARLLKDQRWFLVVFLVKVALGLVAFGIKPWLGLLFFATYAVYFYREMRAGHADHDAEHAGGQHAGSQQLAPLKLQRRRARPATWAVVVQTVGALAVIFVASQAFVDQLDAIGPMLGLSSAVTALLLSPIATELPEIVNALIWIRQGKTALALANISGAMMIQATVPSGLGLLFTDWRFDTAVTWSGIVTIAAILYLLATVRAHHLTAGRLAAALAGYAGFGAGLAVILT